MIGPDSGPSFDSHSDPAGEWEREQMAQFWAEVARQHEATKAERIRQAFTTVSDLEPPVLLRPPDPPDPPDPSYKSPAGDLELPKVGDVFEGYTVVAVRGTTEGAVGFGFAELTDQPLRYCVFRFKAHAGNWLIDRVDYFPEPRLAVDRYARAVVGLRPMLRAVLRYLFLQRRVPKSRVLQ